MWGSPVLQDILAVGTTPFLFHKELLNCLLQVVNHTRPVLIWVRYHCPDVVLLKTMHTVVKNVPQITSQCCSLKLCHFLLPFPLWQKSSLDTFKSNLKKFLLPKQYSSLVFCSTIAIFLCLSPCLLSVNWVMYSESMCVCVCVCVCVCS